jgi:hypothetical protein
VTGAEQPPQLQQYSRLLKFDAEKRMLHAHYFLCLPREVTHCGFFNSLAKILQSKISCDRVRLTIYESETDSLVWFAKAAGIGVKFMDSNNVPLRGHLARDAIATAVTFLSIEKRRKKYPKTFGLLFHRYCEEAEDGTLVKVLCQILGITKENLAKLDECQNQAERILILLEAFGDRIRSFERNFNYIFRKKRLLATSG